MIDERRILILGGGVMQLPAIAAARRLHLEVHVADGNRNAVGAPDADRFHHVDLRDLAGLLSLAQTLAEERLDAVLTAGTDFAYAVAYLTDRLGLPGHSYEAALNATDKGRMRRRLAEAGVPIPSYRVLEPDEPIGTFRGAVVVKPVDNMGARGVVLAADEDAYRKAVAEARRYSRTGRVIVEDRIPGAEYSIDALVQGNRVDIHGVAIRHIALAPAFVELGHTMPATLTREGYRQLTDTFTAAVRALGLSCGAAKGDVFLCSRRMLHGGGAADGVGAADVAVIGEVAARLSGGYMSGWTYPYHSGIDLTEAAIRVALGETVAPAPTRNDVVAERAIVSIPGVVAGVEGLADRPVDPRAVDRDHPSAFAEQVFLRVAPGDRVHLPQNNVEKCGNVIVRATSSVVLAAKLHAVMRPIVVRLQPGEAETAEFLFRRDPPPHGAFRCSPSEDALVAAIAEDRLPDERPLATSPSRRGIWADTAIRSISAVPVLHADGATFAEACALIAPLVRFVDEPPDDGVFLGRSLARALLRGGAAGGYFLLESLTHPEGWEVLRRWL